jgi:hypothetical protein
MRPNAARALIALTAVASTVLPAGSAFAQPGLPAVASAPQLTNARLAGPPPGPPPDCKNHPSFPGCKKKPTGSPAPKP